MKKVTIGHKLYLFPAQWNELTVKDLLAVAHFYNSNITKEQFITYFFAYKTDIPFAKIGEITEYQMLDIENVIDFLLGEVKLVKNLIKELSFLKKKLIGPDDGLTNLTFWQFFQYTEGYFQRYIGTGKEKYLDLLISSLYFENKEFDENQITTNKNRVKRLSPKIKTAILLFYIGSKNFISKKYPDLFEKSKKSNKVSDGLEVVRLVNSLNNDDITKNAEIRNTNLYDALEFLKRQKEKAEELKKRSKNK